MNSFKHVTSNLGIFVLFLIATTETAPKGTEGFYSTDPRIINGTEAELKNTMHQVSIRRRLSDSYFFGTGHICGGSLIAHNVVLTAAHCFVNFQLPKKPYIEASNFIVVMGNLNRYERNNDTLIFDIHHVIVRIPKFNIDTFYQDLAVVFLNGTVPANHPTVRPIRLNTQPVPAGTICQVTGWGRTEQGFISDVLMTLDVPIISNVFCDTQTNFEPGYILDGMMCAGYLEGGSDACDGDSGGPMVCNGTLAGITSWSDGCAKPLYPGVYTDVAYFEPWIRKVVHVMGVDLEGGTMSSYKNSNVLIIAMAFVVTCLIGSHS